VTGNIRALLDRRDLIFILTWRDIRIRYKQAAMGFLWAILIPAIAVTAAIMVRVAVAQWSGGQVSMGSLKSVMIRAVAWSFFIAGIRFGTNSLVLNTNLVTKIAFPKEVFPISATLASLFDFAIAFAAVLLIMALTGWRPTFEVLWGIPLVALLTLLTMGFALLLSAANLFFRDVKYIVEALLTYAVFFTPVLYEASDLGKWRPVLLLNPVAPLLESMADTLAYGRPPDLAWTAYSAVVAVVIFSCSYWLFKQLESKFAESI
jgi:ABC-type polysaccharide/polyol phosphate export permease